MGHAIEKRDGICEVRLFGDVSKFELLLIVAELSFKDPGKRHPDLWIIGAEVQIPYARFKGVSEGIRFAHVKPPASRRTAIVAADELQRAQCELFRVEAIAALPLDIRVFMSYEEAVAWVQSPECPTATRA